MVLLLFVQVADVLNGVNGSDSRKAHLQWRLEEIRVIRAGTLPRLVEALTLEPYGELDSSYVNTLLATYRTFTTPLKLFNEIKARYAVCVCVCAYFEALHNFNLLLVSHRANFIFF